MKLKTWAGLILCNLIWSFHPVMGKWLLSDFTPVQGAWLRYSSAFLAYLFIHPFLKSPTFKAPLFLIRPRADTIQAIFLGFLAFCFAPLAQLSGLNASRATDNALIVAMEPLITVALAWLVLKERLSGLYVLAFGISVLGFVFLAGILPTSWSVENVRAVFLSGDLLILLSLVGEASYSVIGRDLAQRQNAVSIFGTASLVGALCLSGVGGGNVFQPSHFTPRSMVALIWLGPLGTTGAYLYWLRTLTRVPIRTLALTLFCQPLFGALWGRFFLQERLTWVQSAGAGLILGGVLIPILVPLLARGRFNASR